MTMALSGTLLLLAILAAVTGFQGFLQGRGSVADSEGASPTVDSEIRFYSVYWLAYGATCAWVGLNLAERLYLAPILAAVLFASGLGRVLSYIQTGKPHSTYVAYIVAEIGVSVLMFALYAAVMN